MPNEEVAFYKIRFKKKDVPALKEYVKRLQGESSPVANFVDVYCVVHDPTLDHEEDVALCYFSVLAFTLSEHYGVILPPHLGKWRGAKPWDASQTLVERGVVTPEGREFLEKI